MDETRAVLKLKLTIENAPFQKIIRSFDEKTLVEQVESLREKVAAQKRCLRHREEENSAQPTTSETAMTSAEPSTSASNEDPAIDATKNAFGGLKLAVECDEADQPYTSAGPSPWPLMHNPYGFPMGWTDLTDGVMEIRHLSADGHYKVLARSIDVQSLVKVFPSPWYIPLAFGWNRYLDNNGDVVYKTPYGEELRTLREIAAYMQTYEPPPCYSFHSLPIDFFTFSKNFDPSRATAVELTSLSKSFIDFSEGHEWPPVIIRRTPGNQSLPTKLMHSALLYESFFFCPRDDLERLQPLSQTLLDMIVGGSNVLPLRPIYLVEMDYDEDSKDKLLIYVEDDEDADEQVPDYEDSLRFGARPHFAQTFLRLQNVCVRYFNVGVRDSPFLHYWMAQEAASFTVVRIDFGPATEYDLLDSIVNHLRPRSVILGDEETSFNADLKLLTRDSFLNNIILCRFKVYDDPFPISSFVLSERGYPNYELRCHQSHVVEGIDGLIESFVREGCANKRLQSVCIEWEDGDGPQSSASKQLIKPTKADVPLPKICLTKWLTHYLHRVTQCETHCFVNKMQWKRMEVHKWTVEYEVDDGRRTSHILQCRVMSL